MSGYAVAANISITYRYGNYGLELAKVCLAALCITTLGEQDMDELGALFPGFLAAWSEVRREK